MEGNHNSQNLHTLLIKICETKPIYGAKKSFINRGQPQFSKASHTLDQDSVKQNQFMMPTKTSSNEFNHNSQKLHTLLIKICEAKPIYGANKSFIEGVQPQFSKASHTLDQDSVKQNQFMVLTRASSIEGNHNSQKLHTIDQDSVKQNQFMVPIRASSKEFNHNSQKLHTP
ncbi:unnamed protein product [Malus baccata var. baccata]